MWFHPTRSTFSVLRALHQRAVLRPKPEAAPRGLALPCRARSPGPRAVSAGKPGALDDASSPGLFLPYDTCRVGRPVDRRQIPPPPRAACGVWLPPARRPLPALPTRRACRSVHGLHPSRSSPRRDRYPFRGPCPPAVGPVLEASPKGSPCDGPGFRASFPRRVRSVTGTARVPAADSFLGFGPPEHAPVRPGARIDRVDRGASPLALRRLDVQARPGLRVFQCERVGRSVSGPPALLGFRTFRRCGAPYAGPRGGLMASPHARPARRRSGAIQAPRTQRNSKSRACCPAPAPIGLRSVTSSVRQCLFFKDPRRVGAASL
jgi:hypothetical protein